MKKSLILATFLASQAFAISVDFYDEQQNNASATGIRLRINNDSNTPINNAKLRYYFHKSSQSYAVDGYYLANAAMTVTEVNDDLAYFEIIIPSIPVGYYPDMAGFSLALHNTDWSSRNKIQDYSYQVSSSLAENTKVVLLSGDDVLFGVDPNAQSESEPKIVKISGLKFSANAWLELKNAGTSAVNLSDYQIIDVNYSVFSVSGSLGAGEIFRICQNQTACGHAEKSQILSNFSWGDDGEALLMQGGSIVSYVAWGQPGSHANNAVDAGVWNDAQSFFPTETQVQSFNADYTKDTFFRLKSNKSGANTDDWFSFTSNDDPTETVSVPLPIKTSANKPIIKQIPGDNEVLFSWLPVQGVNSYRVVVRDKNGNDVYNLNTSSSSISLTLTPGNYSWTVIGDDEFRTKYNNGTVINTPLYNIDIVNANIDTSIYKQLHIHQIKARRDTKMLDLGYAWKLNEYSWDRPNIDSKIVEPHEASRCWAVAIQIMNHAYGGNLTQDEIVFKGFFRTDEPLVSPFFDDGGGIIKDALTNKLIGGEIPSTLMWALNIKNIDDLYYTEGTPSYETVKNAIDDSTLIYINTPNHSMVIFGYVGNSSNYAFYYAFDGNNNGNITTSLNYHQPIESYFIPKITGNVRNSEPRISMDSDGDGITNFEEEERFHTNPFLADSDNDGIEDKREIYNYTNVEPKDYIKTDWTPYIFPQAPYQRFLDVGIENPVYEAWAGIIMKADKNINKITAERDPDEDENGIDDGLQKVNKQKNAVNIDNMDIPDDYTIFAREYVTINDNVKCYNTLSESDSYCKIISNDEDIFSYNSPYIPVSIGAHVHVGDIDYWHRGHNLNMYPNIRGKMALRSFAVVHGNINAYVVEELSGQEYKKIDTSIHIAKEIYAKKFKSSNYIDMYNGSSVQGEVNLHVPSALVKNYTYLYSTNMPSIPENRVLQVSNGETYHLKGGDLFKTLHVQAGGTLIIEPGEMFIDSILQVDANAIIRFANPGKGTVLHTNGQIIWHTYNSEPLTNTQYWINVAKGFKLAHHSSQKFYLEGMWAGTVYAPKAKVIMGQVTKTIYGRVLARDVVIHQFTKMYRIDFNPTDAMQVAYTF